jgi:hypothetical protein
MGEEHGKRHIQERTADWRATLTEGGLRSLRKFHRDHGLLFNVEHKSLRREVLGIEEMTGALYIQGM